VGLLAPHAARDSENRPLTAFLIRAFQQAGRYDEAMALIIEAADRFPDFTATYYGYYYRYTKGGEAFTA
jgi:hypothetical protein